MNEAQLLKKQIEEADLTPTNPKIRGLIVNELEHWLESYVDKQTMERYDCFGGPGEIPDEIDFEGRTYTPQQIVEEARAETETGLNVINTIYSNMPKVQFYQDPKEMADMVESFDLDEIMFRCTCGDHNTTGRDFFQGIINADPDNIALRAAVSPEAVIMLYKE